MARMSASAQRTKPMVPVREPLFVTVENHVMHILNKLGFNSRARIAAWHASRDSAGHRP